MSFNPVTDCPDESCLASLNFTDVTCTTYDELLAEFNRRTDLLAQALCCVAGKRTIIANARFNNPTASSATPIGTYGALTGISANRFTALQSDPENIFTAVATGVRINKEGKLIIATQLRTNTFSEGGSVPAGFQASGDGVFVNGTLFASMPDEEKDASTASISAWQILSHQHINVNANDIIAPAARSLSHDAIVWSGETILTYIGNE